MHAIRTQYRKRWYRSRLEARWAAFFDAMGWGFEYEPFDCNGWIPDFALVGKDKNVLVEVKPALDDIEPLKVSAEGYETLGLCATPFKKSLRCRHVRSTCTEWGPPILGVLFNENWGFGYSPPQADGDANMHDNAVLCDSHGTKPMDFHAVDNSYMRRIDGLHDGDHYTGLSPKGWQAALDAWEEAGNIVQWMPRAS